MALARPGANHQLDADPAEGSRSSRCCKSGLSGVLAPAGVTTQASVGFIRVVGLCSELEQVLGQAGCLAHGYEGVGTIGQGVSGMKKYGLPANSGAVQGARYNARTMVHHVAETHFGVHLPRPVVAPNDLIEQLLTTATRAPELWNQKSYLARAFSLDSGEGILDQGIVRVETARGGFQ